MAFYNANGFNIHYESFKGQGTKNILLIHGNLASNEWWYPTIELLKDRSDIGTIVTAEWRGYGQSKGINDKSEIDFDLFADDYLGLIDDQGLSDVHVVGHSTGGLIAMKAILKKPELFSSLVLLDSVGAKGIIPPVPLEQLLIHFETMASNKDYCQQTLAATIEGVDQSSMSFQKIFDVTWNCDKPMWTGVIENLCTKIDIIDRMAELKLPTLIMHGEKDLVLPLAGSQELHQQIQGSKFKVLADQGHSYNMENPQAFSDDLTNFWSAL